jgi:hypothetical protein
MIPRLIQNTPSLRHTPSPRRTTAARKINIVNPIWITVNPIVINIIVRIFIWPKFILAVDPVEANVWFVSMAVGEFSDVALSIDSYSVHGFLEALVFFIKEVFFEHRV